MHQVSRLVSAAYRQYFLACGFDLRSLTRALATVLKVKQKRVRQLRC